VAQEVGLSLWQEVHGLGIWYLSVLDGGMKVESVSADFYVGDVGGEVRDDRFGMLARIADHVGHGSFFQWA